ncbi:periodic tryptophan protein 1 homolog [Fagus crenata]
MAGYYSTSSDTMKDNIDGKYIEFKTTPIVVILVKYILTKDEDSENAEDMTINPTDVVLVCAHSGEDVWIYEESDDGDPNVYVHHDIIISANPLCTAWLDCPLEGGEKVAKSFLYVVREWNLIAVGSMEPSIKIWDLDIIDEVQPCVVLGGIAERKEKKKKVQAVAWNHHAPQVILTGSFDRSIVMKDGRMPEHSGYKWSVTADVESLAWDPHTEHSFVGFDVRAAKSDAAASVSKPSFTLHAHDKAVCTVSYNPSAPNLLATGSEDKMVKLWDLSNNQPSCIASTNPKAGAVFSVSFSEDSPFLLAIGGSKGNLEVWDTLSDAAVQRRFGNYIKQKIPQPSS